MLSGFEALGAASAVLQVISFAADLAIACKNAYDGATTSQDDLERHSKEMFEAVGRVNTRCEQMATANSKFANPNLQTMAHDCKDAAKKLEDEVQYITKIQAKGNVLKSLRKTFRVSRHRKTIQTVEESLSRYQHLIHTELMSHLCSQSEAIDLQQEQSFHKLDSDIQLLVTQLAKGVIEVEELTKKEHATTRAVIAQEAARAERSISTHIDTQVLDLKTTAEIDQRCRAFLQSLKADCMNQRYNDIMDPRDATFEQVFATYQEMMAMYCDECESDDVSDDSGYPENEQGSEGSDSKHDYPQHDQDSDGKDDWEHHVDTNSGHSQPSRSSSDQSYSEHVKVIWSSWESFIKWLQSDEMLFYVEGKPGSGKSTLVKFILEHGQTRNLIRQWSPDATIIRHFFWKIGSHEQNSIKGLWCSLLYQRLQDRLSVIPDILQCFQHLSLHSSYHDWTIKDLQNVWEYTMKLDGRHLCIFVDGLDEIRNEDGFSRLVESIQLLLEFPRTKLCVSTRPEARIMRWLQETSAIGFRLEDLTRHDMILFVRKELHPLLRNKSGLSRTLRESLVVEAQGVFLWLHLALQSLIEGIAHDDDEDMLLRRLDGLPKDLETLYMDMWQRLNANNSVYCQTAARYFRYVMQCPSRVILFHVNGRRRVLKVPFSFQIACADNPDIQETLLRGGTIETSRLLRICEATEISIRTRCAGLLTFRPLYAGQVGDKDAVRNAFGKVVFIHRTAHDFLKDTEAGCKILGYDPSSDLILQCGLLKGFVCSIMVSSCHWGVRLPLPTVIYVIVGFATSWGSLDSQASCDVLDAIRSLYDKAMISIGGYERERRRPFFSFLTNVVLFDDFVISRLTTEASVELATDTLREAWIPGSHATLSKRLFNALLSLGADPHHCGASSSYTIPGPFVSNTTAFANLLLSFYISREKPHGLEDPLASTVYNSLYGNDSSEVIEMATKMARTYEYLNTTALLVGHFSRRQMMDFESLQIMLNTTGYGGSNVYSIIYEVNLQFLLLYLLSRAGEDLAGNVLEGLGAEDLLQKVNNPWIRMRYFLHPETGQPIPHKCISVKCHRVAPEASYLPKHLIEDFLRPRTDRSTMDYIFKVDMKRHSGRMYVLYDTGTDLGTVMHGIKDSEIKEVTFETMMTGLAHESRDISADEETDIIPSAAYTRNQR